ncbi:hypothetical protein AUV08_00475 [Micrococcus sp. CH7]|nr:hypothetical protein AUV08_00475 [Micrococcus sp. CH7]
MSSHPAIEASSGNVKSCCPLIRRLTALRVRPMCRAMSDWLTCRRPIQARISARSAVLISDSSMCPA